MNIIVSEEQKRPCFGGLHAFLTKIPSPRRKQRTVVTRHNDDEDESNSGYLCPYVSPNSKKTSPHKNRISTSDLSVASSSVSSSSSSVSSKSGRVRKATLRSLFQRQSVNKSKEDSKSQLDDDDDDQVSLLLATLPLEQQDNAATDDLSGSDWNSNSWRENDSYQSIHGKFHTSQSTLDPDISLLFFSCNDLEEEENNMQQPVLETPTRRSKPRKQSIVRTHLQLEFSPCSNNNDDDDDDDQRQSSPSSHRRTPQSPRRRRHTRPRTRLRVKHASSA